MVHDARRCELRSRAGNGHCRRSVGTAWAPRHVGKELRQARLAAADADWGAIRAAAEAEAARKADDHGRAGRQDELAASYRALGECYRQRETVFTQAMAGLGRR
jgi:hypothetical protein